MTQNRNGHVVCPEIVWDLAADDGDVGLVAASLESWPLVAARAEVASAAALSCWPSDTDAGTLGTGSAGAAEAAVASLDTTSTSRSNTSYCVNRI